MFKRPSITVACLRRIVFRSHQEIHREEKSVVYNYRFEIKNSLFWLLVYILTYIFVWIWTRLQHCFFKKYNSFIEKGYHQIKFFFSFSTTTPQKVTGDSTQILFHIITQYCIWYILHGWNRMKLCVLCNSNFNPYVAPPTNKLSLGQRPQNHAP